MIHATLGLLMAGWLILTLNHQTNAAVLGKYSNGNCVLIEFAALIESVDLGAIVEMKGGRMVWELSHCNQLETNIYIQFQLGFIDFEFTRSGKVTLLSSLKFGYMGTKKDYSYNETITGISISNHKDCYRCDSQQVFTSNTNNQLHLYLNHLRIEVFRNSSNEEFSELEEVCEQDKLIE